MLNPDPSSPLRRQLAKSTYFPDLYDPDPLVDNTRYPVDDFDFSPAGAYAIYNWELFFHAPLLIACRLMQNQDEHAWQVALSQEQIVSLPTDLHHTVTINGVQHESLNPDAVEDLGIICVYTLTTG